MSTRNGEKKKSPPYTPPAWTETGPNTEDYDFRFARPLHDGETRLIVSPKSRALPLTGARGKQKEGTLNGKPIKIKSVRLDKKVLFINNGQVVIPFNSSGDPEGTKTYKMFNALWLNRHEMKGNEITNRNHDTMSMGNLKRVSGVPTKGALDKQVNRLNKRFSEKGLAMWIANRGDQYKLVIKLD